MANKYDIAAYIWPSYTGDEPRSRFFWPDGYGEWQTVKNAKSKTNEHIWPRKPLWGYVNEADPYVMEMEIDAAADHGVNVFIYDWYWYDNRPFLEQCLNNGYLKARNNDRVKFYIMWANHVATTLWDVRTAHLNIPIWEAKTDKTVFKTICERLIKMYFTHPNYYKIGGKPVFQIYDFIKFIDDLGGMEGARWAMDYMQCEAIKAGLDGVHFQISLRAPVKELRVHKDYDGSFADAVDYLGFDSSTHYQFCGITNAHRPYPEVLADAMKVWDECREAMKATYYPHVSLGWDTNPRFIPLKPSITTETTPENIKKGFIEAKKYVDAHPELPVPLITVTSWNEWTESSYLQPDDINGYGYLEALREVFVGE